MTRVFHAWPYGRFTEIKSNLRRKKLHIMNQSSNFLGNSFGNRDNVRTPIQFRRKSLPSILKENSYSRTDTHIHFHINSTSVIRLIKQNQQSFSSIEMNKLLLAPTGLVDQIQVQKPILVTATDLMPENT